MSATSKIEWTDATWKLVACEERDAEPPVLLERGSAQTPATKRAGRNCLCVEGRGTAAAGWRVQATR
ncbi:MAG: hypothetical protein ACRDJ9_35245 [Dehalococcoidia bacterium]